MSDLRPYRFDFFRAVRPDRVIAPLVRERWANRAISRVSYLGSKSVELTSLRQPSNKIAGRRRDTCGLQQTVLWIVTVGRRCLADNGIGSATMATRGRSNLKIAFAISFITGWRRLLYPRLEYFAGRAIQADRPEQDSFRGFTRIASRYPRTEKKTKNEFAPPRLL